MQHVLLNSDFWKVPDKIAGNEFALPVKALGAQIHVRVVVQVSWDEVLPVGVDQIRSVYNLENPRAEVISHPGRAIRRRSKWVYFQFPSITGKSFERWR